MKYFRCALGGSIASVLTGIVYILISLAFSLSSEGFKDNFVGFGFVSAEFTVGPLFLSVLLAGFAIGFFWILKRASKPGLNI